MDRNYRAFWLDHIITFVDYARLAPSLWRRDVGISAALDCIDYWMENRNPIGCTVWDLP